MFSVNHIYVKADRELSNSEIFKIRSIFKESGCPNESLCFTFGDSYRGVDNDHYIFNFESGEECISMAIEL